MGLLPSIVTGFAIGDVISKVFDSGFALADIGRFDLIESHGINSRFAHCIGVFGIEGIEGCGGYIEADNRAFFAVCRARCVVVAVGDFKGVIGVVNRIVQGDAHPGNLIGKAVDQPAKAIPRHFERQFPGTAARCGLPALAGPLVAVMGHLAGVGLMGATAALASHVRLALVSPGGCILRTVSGAPFEGQLIGFRAVGGRFRLEQGIARAVALGFDRTDIHARGFGGKNADRMCHVVFPSLLMV